jgi:hypothetical protein
LRFYALDEIDCDHNTVENAMLRLQAAVFGLGLGEGSFLLLNDLCGYGLALFWDDE